MISKDLEQIFGHAVRNAEKQRHEWVCLEHLLLAMLEDRLILALLEHCDADRQILAEQLSTFLAGLESVSQEREYQLEQTLAVTRVLRRAVVHVQSAGKNEVDAGDVLASMFRESDSHAVYFLQEQGLTRLAILQFLSHGESSEYDEDADAALEGSDADFPDDADPDADPASPPKAKKDPLADYTQELVAQAREGHIDPLIGRKDELKRVIQILARRRKNNPLLVGEPGVGKTAIAEGLALAIHLGAVPELLQECTVYALDMGSLIAGTKFRGEFEQRLKKVLKALAERKGALLFIDEIHTIVGAGAISGGALDASNILKPALASGKLRCIGATTHKEYRAAFEKDAAFARRFQKIEIAEPSADDAYRILRGLKSHYEDFHQVAFPDAVLKAAISLSSSHVLERRLPDKAIDIIDEVGASIRLNKSRTGKRARVADVEAMVAQIAKIPTKTVKTKDKERLATLSRDLELVIYGQNEAIVKIVSAVKLSRAGLGHPNRPVGSFLFSGPTGVGKTELAKQLARCLGIEVLRFDMSEYMEKHTVSRLIGAPPGYVGFDQGGLLTDAVIAKPHAVLILDEIEKAHPDVFNLLLQVMDNASLTDNNGRKADFRHIVLIMTTNAGTHEMSSGAIGFGQEGESRTGDAKRAIERTFSPEFRNRLDAWVQFAHLEFEAIEEIVDKLIAELEAQLRPKQISLELSPKARRWLAKNGYDRRYGARPMSRCIDEALRRPLAEEILFGKLQQGGHVQILRAEDGDGLALEYGETHEASEASLTQDTSDVYTRGGRPDSSVGRAVD